MKIRGIRWYRMEDELCADSKEILEEGPPGIPLTNWWLGYNFLNVQRHTPLQNRDEFERLYLEWKSQNEG